MKKKTGIICTAFILNILSSSESCYANTIEEQPLKIINEDKGHFDTGGYFTGQIHPMKTEEKIVVLTYHLISNNPKDWSDFCISPVVFENDIISLKNQNYIFLKASELANTDISNKKIAVITFDDGYKSDIEYAVPVLKKYNACATFFIYGDGVGKNGYLSEADVKAMSKEKCAEIGNHSFSLHNRPKDAIVSMFKNKETVIADFQKNGAFLEKITGNVPTALSYPNGVYSSEVNSRLINSGIKITFSTDEIQFKKPTSSKAVGRKNRSSNKRLENLIK